MDEKYAPHIEELTKALANVDRSKVEDEFNLLINYRVPISEAKRTILKKFRSLDPVTTDVKDLSIGDKGVFLEVRILDIGERTVDLKGERTTIFSGVLADRSGLCPFTSWKQLALNAGDAVRISNASGKNWHNRVEVSISAYSEVILLDDSSLPDISELSVTPVKKLIDVGPSDLFLSSVAAIIDLYHRNVEVKGEDLTIIEGVLADETGRLPFVSWSPLDGMDIGSMIRFKDASVRMYRGVPSIHLDSSIQVESVGADEDLSFDPLAVNKPPEPVPISNVLQAEGMFDVAVEGNIVSVRPGSGLITRCPVCNRVIIKNVCRSHGAVDGLQDMRVKLILDDGTGSVLVMLNRELSELVYGKSLHESFSLLGKTMSMNAIFEDMKRVLTGRYLGVRGNTSRIEFGVTFVTKAVWVPGSDIEERVPLLLNKLDGVE
ncbi:Single-stranded DNA binding protein [Methanococcoides alaskense]|uniref:Replication factor A1 n=1 Tax=Methanococcoides alaskense TaxID=325778 RepID=A0AA90TXT3_9EURY|nr:Single-stranded DNA binding protein [Methanococcoides alaskense]MDA0525054.1 Single-stranded DNA binding protein [Methanococcoides alaskense]MDR6222030.1 replication factor A1 [Methanococcoides alaskense]